MRKTRPRARKEPSYQRTGGIQRKGKDNLQLLQKQLVFVDFSGTFEGGLRRTWVTLLEDVWAGVFGHVSGALGMFLRRFQGGV